MVLDEEMKRLVRSLGDVDFCDRFSQQSQLTKDAWENDGLRELVRDLYSRLLNECDKEELDDFARRLAHYGIAVDEH